jgi:hypothetical protein
MICIKNTHVSSIIVEIYIIATWRIETYNCLTLQYDIYFLAFMFGYVTFKLEQVLIHT